MAPISFRRHRFPPVVIQHAVWLYLRFTLSYRDVEELLAERGLDLSYESVRSWRSRRPSWRKLGIPGTQDDGTGHRRRSSLAITLVSSSWRGFCRLRDGPVTHPTRMISSRSGSGTMHRAIVSNRLMGSGSEQ